MYNLDKNSKFSEGILNNPILPGPGVWDQLGGGQGNMGAGMGDQLKKLARMLQGVGYTGSLSDLLWSLVGQFGGRRRGGSDDAFGNNGSTLPGGSFGGPRPAPLEEPAL